MTDLRRGPSRFGILSIDQIFVEQMEMIQPSPVFDAFGTDEAASSFLFIEKLQVTETDQVRSSQADLNAFSPAVDLRRQREDT